MSLKNGRMSLNYFGNFNLTGASHLFLIRQVKRVM